jgi:hypothetical protein
VVNDMDHHPYTRCFRGVYYSSEPIVMEREAGWRPLHNKCYNPGMVVKKRPLLCPEPEPIDYTVDDLQDGVPCKCIVMYR